MLQDELVQLVCPRPFDLSSMGDPARHSTLGLWGMQATIP